jgi:hypothetical protein
MVSLYLIMVGEFVHLNDLESYTSGSLLLVGASMLGWSKNRDQTKRDTLVLQVGGKHGVNYPIS